MSKLIAPVVLAASCLPWTPASASDRFTGPSGTPLEYSSLNPSPPADLVGAWVGEVTLPSDEKPAAGRIGKREKTIIVLALRSDGVGGVVFLQSARDLDPTGEKGLTYDYPLTGPWKFSDGEVTLTPDPAIYPPGEVKPFKLKLSKPGKDQLVLDLAAMAAPAPLPLMVKAKINLHSATQQELQQWLGGKRPE